MDFKKLDFVSEEIGFEVNSSRRYKTNFGAVLSIIIFIISLILAIIIGKEVYQRKLPSVSISSDFLAESVVSLKQYPIFFTVQNPSAKTYDDFNKYLSIGAYKLNATNNIVEYDDYLKTDFHKCTLDDFSAYKGKIDDYVLKTYFDMSIYCLTFDENYEIKNKYTTANSSFIDLSFSYCEGENCAEDLEFALKEIYVSLYYMNAYVDSNNYGNPIKYYIDIITQGLSKGFLKKKYVRFINNEYHSDNGWLLENQKTYNYIALQSIYDEINLISPSYPTDMYWVTLDSPNIREIGKRSYMKVQDLFAKVGGIINALFIIVNLLFFDYLRFIYMKDIAHYLISSKDSKFEMNNNISSLNVNDKSNINSINQENNIESNNLNYYHLKLNPCANIQKKYVENAKNIKDTNNKINALNRIKFINKKSFSKSAYIASNNNININNNKEIVKVKEPVENDIITDKNLKVSHNINSNVDCVDDKYYEEYSNKINNTDNNILKFSKITDCANQNYLQSLHLFKSSTKDELLFKLKNISYLKYLMYTIFNCKNDNDEFIKHLNILIREKIDFFKNIKKIAEDLNAMILK